MANIVRDRREHPDAIMPDLSKADPLVTFSKDDIALCIREQMEAAVFQEGRGRLLSVAGPVGRNPQNLARLQCEARNRLVDSLLSGR